MPSHWMTKKFRSWLEQTLWCALRRDVVYCVHGGSITVPLKTIPKGFRICTVYTWRLSGPTALIRSTFNASRDSCNLARARNFKERVECLAAGNGVSKVLAVRRVWTELDLQVLKLAEGEEGFECESFESGEVLIQAIQKMLGAKWKESDRAVK